MREEMKRKRQAAQGDPPNMPDEPINAEQARKHAFALGIQGETNLR